MVNSQYHYLLKTALLHFVKFACIIVLKGEEIIDKLSIRLFTALGKRYTPIDEYNRI